MSLTDDAVAALRPVLDAHTAADADLAQQTATTVEQLTRARDTALLDAEAQRQRADSLKAQLDDCQAGTEPPPDPEPQTVPYVGLARGQVVNGKQQGNLDPSAIEQQAGRPLGVRVTYWNMKQIDSAVSTMVTDAKVGRIAWPSFKLSDTWAAAAGGASDDDAANLVQKIANAKLPIPPWLTIHHEPEGDQPNLQDWVKVQQRLLPQFGRIPGLRTAIVLTAYDTFLNASTADDIDKLWPGSVASIMGFDAYNPYDNDANPGKGWKDMKAWYDLIAPAAKARGVDWAIRETGYTDTAAVRDAAWLTRGYDDMATHSVQPGLAFCYWDSMTADKPENTWRLNSVKTPLFVGILKRSRRPVAVS